MAEMEAAEVAREDLVKSLHLVEDPKDLAEICIALDVQVPPNKTGKRSALFSLILKNLMSTEMEESDDSGLAVFQDIYAQVDAKIKRSSADKVNNNSTDIKTEENSGMSTGKNTVTGGKQQLVKDATFSKSSIKDSSGERADSKDHSVIRSVERIRLEKFKIHGGVVGGEKNKVDYQSLIHQIEEGKGLGHSMKEILSGVVRAMEAGSGLKRWFEKRPDVSEERAMNMLRSHYELDSRDSMTLLTELKNSAQEPTESVKKYVFRMMDLRDTILDLSVEEDSPLQKSFVNKRFYDALSVGITVDTIRLELLGIFKEASLEDDELLKQINLVVARYKEHLGKIKPKPARVNHQGVSFPDDTIGGEGVEEKETEKEILMELKKLNKSNVHLTAKVNELSTNNTNMKGELADLRKHFQNNSNGDGDTDAANVNNVPNGGAGRAGGAAGGGRRNNNFFVKCSDCARTRAYCTHCTICGSVGHKRAQCPTLND